MNINFNNYLALLNNGDLAKFFFIYHRLKIRIRMNMSAKSRNISGVTGTYYVAAELSRRNYIALVTVRNTKGVDIVVSNLELNKSVFVQVKTDGSYQGFWTIDKPFSHDNLFYVLVSITEKDPPKFYIIPSKTVYEKYDKEMKEKAQYKEYYALNDEDKNNIIKCLNAKKSHYQTQSELKIKAEAIVQLAREQNLKVSRLRDITKWDGDKYPWCYYLEDVIMYENRWDLLSI